MGNITENKLNAVLTAADLTAINTGLAAVMAKLPAVSLTDEQRNNLKSIDVNNKIFVEDAIAEVTANGSGIIPAFISPAFIKNDLDLFEQMDLIESTVRVLLDRITDIKRITGDESYTASLAAYRIFDGAAQAGVLNAKTSYAKLRSRFEQQGRPANTTP